MAGHRLGCSDDIHSWEIVVDKSDYAREDIRIHNCKTMKPSTRKTEHCVATQIPESKFSEVDR